MSGCNLYFCTRYKRVEKYKLRTYVYQESDDHSVVSF